ncbi:hypothetical protein [[Pseudomonas] boreopolis]|uniref:hypothetical protein n=1 Tax=Xanthomonas boreopolis TaxID=86183 RepID=UPI003D565DD9
MAECGARAAGERFVMFSGANERALVALCRAFARRGLSCSIAARPGPDPIRHTRYRAWIEAERGSDQLELQDLLRCVRAIAARHPGRRLLLLPTAESVNRLALRHRAEFEQAGLQVPLVDEAIYLAVSDKASLLALAARFGLEPPPMLEAPVAEALPLVAKPRCEFAPDSGRKLYPELIFERARLERFLATHEPDHYFFQRYLDGASYYYLAHFDRGGNARFAYQRNLAQQANGKSIVAAELCECPDADTRQRLQAMFRAIGYHGYAMVEVMLLHGRSYLIEVNPRFWGPWTLADRAGFLPEACDGRPLATSGARSGRYLWLGGWLAERRAGRRMRRYPGLRLPTLLALACSDVYLRPDSLPLFLRELLPPPRLRSPHPAPSGSGSPS